MSSATITRPVPNRTRRTATVAGPLARPARIVPAWSGRSGRAAAMRSCRVASATVPTPWRLTDRGIALVLVLAAMIVLAAVAVIGLTAWQVTGPDYQAWSAMPVSSS